MQKFTPEKYIEFIIKNLVNHPEDIKISRIDGTKETIIEIRVHQEDVGKVIGKNGSVVRALRTIVSAIGNREKKNYILEVID
ncbi:MAG: KH domain-containing protein [Leptospiraceae bacterium]|jgi:predicted RNA-binding protein YlqC (UPF0109 family)|nr:KH domain-containing protein [Leptospiraceae bacterium]